MARSHVSFPDFSTALKNPSFTQAQFDTLRSGLSDDFFTYQPSGGQYATHRKNQTAYLDLASRFLPFEPEVKDTLTRPCYTHAYGNDPYHFLKMCFDRLVSHRTGQEVSAFLKHYPDYISRTKPGEFGGLRHSFYNAVRAGDVRVADALFSHIPPTSLYRSPAYSHLLSFALFLGHPAMVAWIAEKKELQNRRPDLLSPSLVLSVQFNLIPTPTPKVREAFTALFLCLPSFLEVKDFASNIALDFLPRYSFFPQEERTRLQSEWKQLVEGARTDAKLLLAHRVVASLSAYPSFDPNLSSIILDYLSSDPRPNVAPEYLSSFSSLLDQITSAQQLARGIVLEEKEAAAAASAPAPMEVEAYAASPAVAPGPAGGFVARVVGERNRAEETRVVSVDSGAAASGEEPASKRSKKSTPTTPPRP